MRVDEGAAMIVRRKGEDRYLVLKRDKNWSGWEFPKGHLEHGSHRATVLVELSEEAGIEPVDVNRINETGEHLTFRHPDSEVVSYFRCFEVVVDPETDVDLTQNPSEEHSDYRWVPADEAKELLEHEEQRELMNCV